MKKLKIILFGDPVLREKAREVTVFHKKLHALVDSIKITLSDSSDGAALAANQVSILKRITVINYLDEYHEMINPEIVSFSGEQTGIEGCLSFPGYSGRVKRHETVKVSFRDRNGNEKIIERSGKMARCLQHEIDHLNGILFIDRMDDEFLYNDDTGKRLSKNVLLKITPPDAG